MFVVSWMSDWLKQIVMLVLIATFIDLILPNNRLEKYVKLVMGLLIIMAIISPVFGLLSDDPDLESLAFLPAVPAFSQLDSMKEIGEKSETLKQEQEHLIHQQAEQKISQSIKTGLEKQFPVKVKKTEVKFGVNEVESVRVSILPQKSESSMSMKPVEPVNIEPESFATVPKSETEPDFKPLKQDVMRYIEETWDVPMEKIVVEIHDQTRTSFIDHRVYLTVSDGGEKGYAEKYMAKVGAKMERG